MIHFINIILSAILFGISPVLCKLIINDFSTFTMSGLLYLGASFSTLLTLKTNFNIYKQLNRNIILLILSGGILAPICLLAALKKISAMNVSIWFNLEPVFTILIALLLFKEHLTRKSYVGVIGVFIALAMFTHIDFNIDNLLNYMMIILACLFYAIDNNLASVIDSIKPSQLVFLKGFTAAIINLLLGICFFKDMIFGLNSLYFMLIGFFSYGVSLILYIRASQNLGAIRAQLIFATSSIWGLIFSVWIFHEVLNLTQILATLLIMGSLYLILKDMHGHSHWHESMTHTHFHIHTDGHHNHQHTGIVAFHTHEHSHDALKHSHEHISDIHHRHSHD